jgi:hypothetical protein
LRRRDEDGEAAAAFEAVAAVGRERPVATTDGENVRAIGPRNLADRSTDGRVGGHEVEIDDAVAARAGVRPPTARGAVPCCVAGDRSAACLTGP